jgi:phytoene synthase
VKPESAGYVARAIREADRDRYLSTLVLPAVQRGALTALYAFNAEIASVPERAREPAAGEIRLRWWADALEGDGHGDVRANPVADALLSVIAEYRLPTAALVRLIDARRFDLYNDPMPDLASFEGYAGETTSVLYQLAAMIMNGGRPVEPGDAAGHLGVAHALIGHLRAFGYNASRGRIFLPWDVFAICGVKQEDVLAGVVSEGLAIALTRLADTARSHLDRAETAIAALPRSLRPAFAMLAVLRLQLHLIDIEWPFQPSADLSDLRKIAALWWWRIRFG